MKKPNRTRKLLIRLTPEEFAAIEAHGEGNFSHFVRVAIKEKVEETIRVKQLLYVNNQQTA